MARADSQRKRCAIYTRKSSEEGLEQEFNSLHAQREACEAFIRSQRHEGWVALPAAFDDGGFSGGNLARPGLQRLLQDVREGRVDVIVTYKVDRLTRSLADFARLIEIFDAHQVSFVSVTQQFNTTSSMGRLTLNVLLSFAQFEREVTGERIRDKIAASKQKGMWMGGVPPLGYDVHEHKLVVNSEEAETVRRIFALYLELGCVRRVKEQADRLGLVTKSRIAKGLSQGGKSFSRGHLYKLLSNPIYIGRIAHKSQLYEGQHAALIDDQSWAAVQARLAGNGPERHRAATALEPSLLTGLLFDAAGERLSPSHAVKQSRRYRYYVSRSLIAEAGNDSKRGWRLPAHAVEDAVIRIAAAALTEPASLIERLGLGGSGATRTQLVLDRAAGFAKTLLQGSPGVRVRLTLDLIRKVVIEEETISIAVRKLPLLAAAEDHLDTEPEDVILLSAPMAFRRRGVETKLLLPALVEMQKPGRIDVAVVKAVARGWLWFQQIANGEVASLEAIAARAGVSARYVSRLLRLSFLAPDLVEAILEGRHPADLSAERLTNRLNLPIDWAQQRQLIRA